VTAWATSNTLWSAFRAGPRFGERIVGIDPVALHHDALGLLYDTAGAQRAAQPAELGVAVQNDVDGVFHLRPRAVPDVGEDPAARGPLDERVIVGLDARQRR